MEGRILHRKNRSFIFKKCIPNRKMSAQTLPTIISMSRTNIEPQNTDSFLHLLAINHFSHNLQAASGIKIQKKGYDGLLEACKEVTINFKPTEQRRIALESLERAIPIHVFPSKGVLPQTKFVRQIFAKFTSLFFVWLVGPVEVKESEFQGRPEKNVAYIKKCKFLEGSKCIGMCTNLCKFPTQEFINDYMGMPVTMTPNFEDMSCEIIFGAKPPSPEEDPATRQPCYKECKNKAGNTHTTQNYTPPN